MKLLGCSLNCVLKIVICDFTHPDPLKKRGSPVKGQFNSNYEGFVMNDRHWAHPLW